MQRFSRYKPTALRFVVLRGGVAALVFALGLLLGAHESQATDTVGLIQDGRSEHRIHIASDAVESVSLAAEELQRWLERSTGARLPIVASDEPLAGPVVSLGDTASLAAAGLEWGAMPLDAFRVVTAGENVFIFGLDEPLDPRRDDFNNASRGTLNGVYWVLERYAGIRWLLPGEHGADVPRTDTITIPFTDERVKPAMFFRLLSRVHDRDDPAIERWLLRNRSGFARRIDPTHAWHRIVPPDRFDRHPHWFPMIDGERVRPSGEHYKLCTSDASLRAHFAAEAERVFASDPRWFSFSIAPNDGGGGWCECSGCKAIDRRAGTSGVAASRRMAEFYADVAKRVQPAFPDRLLIGHVYAEFFDPPRGPAIDMPANLFLMFAPLQNYGFQLFREATRDRFDAAIDAWLDGDAKWGVFDLPVTLHPNRAAFITPPGEEILRYFFDRLSRDGASALLIYGEPAFGFGGIINYALAKLSWDPTLSPSDLVSEFCRRAYGPDAGPMIERALAELDAAFKAYYLEHPRAGYHITPALTRDLFAPRYPALEEAYLDAMGVVTEPDDRARLEAFGDCLAVSGWLLRSRGELGDATPGTGAASDSDVEQIVARFGVDPMLPPSPTRGEPPADLPAVRVESARDTTWRGVETEAFLIRGSSRWVLRRSGAEAPVLRWTAMPLQGLARFVLLDHSGRTLRTGLVKEGQAISLTGVRDTAFLDVLAFRGAYGLAIDGADHALLNSGYFDGQTWLHERGGDFPDLYLSVPRGSTGFEVMLKTLSPNETAAATLFSPDGSAFAAVATTRSPIRRIVVSDGDASPGLWRLALGPAERGGMRYAFIGVSGDVSRWLSLDPGAAARVSEAVSASSHSR